MARTRAETSSAIEVNERRGGDDMGMLIAQGGEYDSGSDGS